MSSAPERRPLLSFDFKLSLWFTLIFLVTTGALMFVVYAMIEDDLAEEWQVELTEVHRAWGEGLPAEALLVKRRSVEAKVKATLGPDTAGTMWRTWLTLAAPMLLIGLLGGLWLVARMTRPVYELNRTIRGILETGDLETRVPRKGAGPRLYDLIGLVNRMLDRIQRLVAGMHESLDNVAHDLRTPLTRMRAVAEQALHRPGDEAVAREALGETLEESERVSTMLTTLMDVAEAETGTMRLHKEAVDVSAIARDAAELYEIVAEEKGVAIETRLPAPLDAQADANRLRQVVANLVDNAVKYSRRGETISIEVAEEDGNALVRVADQGLGIAPGDLPRIFDRLYRGDRSRSERGLGLGLSFVRAIVEAHGGSVSVESEVNRGSTFTVRIPRG